MLAEPILGTWLFLSLIYQGHSMPRPNPSLKITYTFQSDHTNLLHYHHDGEKGFCERRASYEFDGDHIAQKVTWVNPNNAIWCEKDTDMQMDNESWSQAWIENEKLHLVVPLGDEDLIYVWEKIQNQP